MYVCNWKKENILLKPVIIFDVELFVHITVILHFSYSFLSFFQAAALSRVWVNHWSSHHQYKVGDTAILQCEIFSDKETVENCKMSWVILDPNNPDRTMNVMESKLYMGRANVQENNATSTSVTIRDLGLNDTEMPNCSMKCFFDRRLKLKFGIAGIFKIDQISDPQRTY